MLARTASGSSRCVSQLHSGLSGLEPAVRRSGRDRSRCTSMNAHSSAPYSPVAQTNPEAQSSPHPPVERSRGRKRKLASPAVPPHPAGASAVSSSAMASNSHSAPAAGDNSASASGSSAAAYNGGEQPPRGQPLKDFVENWEFRWDLQRQAYPWEWASDSRLSDGPHNIIRCASALHCMLWTWRANLPLVAMSLHIAPAASMPRRLHSNCHQRAS